MEIFSQHVTGTTAYVAVAMATQSILHLAARLRDSLVAHHIEHIIYIVPAIHCSISVKGTPDIEFSKPAFIERCLDKIERPLVYLDADVVLRERPSFDPFVKEGADFAIYNFLADDKSDAFAPISLPFGGKIWKKRFYMLSHKFEMSDSSQLAAAGPTQFYANSKAARKLLDNWRKTIERLPAVADDESLDYTFNTFKRPLKTKWLGREYCRYPFWLTTRPVIDHPQFPDASRKVTFRTVTGAERFDMSKIKKRNAPPELPVDCVIDVYEKRALKIPAQSGTPPDQWTSAPLEVPIWPAKFEEE
ncbi:MAG TPA: hypothetical protein VHD34_09630 [Xanthobacteraceae bacterium]|nr:hypothetical protein [Xanthobacteraceae bacterium]